MTLPRLMLSALLLLATAAQAQQQAQPDIKFQHVTVRDGLSQNAVHSLVQDRRGYLWIATEDGLNHYDGYTFTVYREQLSETPQQGIEAHRVEHPGLTDSLVRVLYEDSGGILWIGTADGLTRFVQQSGAFRHYRHPDAGRGIQTPISVQAITEDLEGRLWVGAAPGGLNQLDRSNGAFEQQRHDAQDPATLSSDNVTSIAMTPDGILWVGTQDAGLNRFDPATGQVRRYTHDPLDSNTTSGSNISGIAVDHRGQLWIATADAGLSRLDPASGEVQRYFHDPDNADSLSSNALRTVYEDSQRRLWIGHHPNAGLDLLDPDSGRFFNYTHRAGVDGTLSDNHVITALEDDGGILWFGTSVGGLNKYNPSQLQFRHYRNEWWTTNSLNSNTIRSFYKDDHLLYIGTAGGLNVLDIRNGDFTHHVHDPKQADSIPNDIVRDIVPDEDGQLWLATHGGLSRFNPDTQRFSNYFHDPQNPASLSSNILWRVHVDREGMVWAGSRGELNRLDPVTGVIRRFQPDPQDPDSIPIDWLLSIHEDSHGNLWFGSICYDPNSETFRNYAPAPDQPAPISNALVMSITEDDNGMLWFGTRGGLNRLDDPEAGHFTQFTTADGLPNNVIYGILIDDDGHFWLSSNRGIARFDPDSGEVNSFDSSHGLQADEFNNGAYYKAENGEMYFGGVNGFNVFDPSLITQNNYEPPLVFTRFLVLDEERNVGHSYPEGSADSQQITLPHNENYLSFEFAALDYSAPEAIHYEYRLHGFNDEWINSGTRRFASYTNLPPGNYRFVVRGTNSDGLWSPHTAEMTFRITPALWQTLWFQFGLLIIASVAVFLLYQYKLFRIHRQNVALEALVGKRTNELQHSNSKLQSEVQQRKDAEEEIRKIAYHDYLTGLPNRRLFTSLCEQSLASAARENQSLALMFVDVDGFKGINDQWGHEAGDVALVAVADRIRGIIRDSDVACRMGGDEFVLLLSGVRGRNAAARVAEKLTLAISAPVSFNVSETGESQTVQIGASIGISLYPEDGRDLETLLSHADKAMYEAKQSDRSYRFFN